jgi:hypothetical protein
MPNPLPYSAPNDLFFGYFLAVFKKYRSNKNIRTGETLPKRSVTNVSICSGPSNKPPPEKWQASQWSSHGAVLILTS